MNKRDIQKQKTKQKIIEVTIGLVAKKGIQGLKTLDVAKTAEIAHGSVFVHFPNRESLLTAAIESVGKDLTVLIHQTAEFRQGLKPVLRKHLEILAKNETFYTALVEETRNLPQSARETMISIQSAISFHIALAAELDMKQGVLKQMPAYLLFNTWLGLIHYYLLNRDLFAPDSSVLKAKGEELLDHFFFLIQQ